MLSEVVSDTVSELSDVVGSTLSCKVIIGGKEGK